MTIYGLKSGFQDLLRPAATGLARIGVTANQVTLTAVIVSIAIGILVTFNANDHRYFAVLPVWFLVRMALNAIDGMLAREFGQESRLGAYLNEISDVISDAALYLPFAFVAPFTAIWIGAIIFLSTLSELAGVLGQTIGASRRYDGPMGKSDRALVFGALGLAVGLASPLPQWAVWIMPAIAALLCLTIVNRIRSGLREQSRPPHSNP